MEASSITPAKTDYRPAGAQAQNELGDLFQDLLRESAWRFETPAAPSRYDNRPDKVEPRRDRVAEPARATTGDRSDPLDRTDENDNDLNIVETQAAAEPRPARDPADTGERTDAGDHTDQPTPTQSADRSQPGQDDGFKPATDNAGTEQQAQKSEPEIPAGAAVNSQAASVGSAPSQTNVQPTLAGSSGGINPTAPVNAGPTPDASTAANEAQIPAKPTGPNQGTATTQAAAATAPGAGIAAQVSVKPAPVVSPPAANLGGGAATAALATATPQDVTGPAAPNVDVTSRAAQGVSNPGTASAAAPGQTVPGTANPPGATPNAPVLSSDGQTVAAQSATAAGAAPKQNSTATTAPAPGTDSLVGPEADADRPNAPSQAGQAAAARNGSATGNPSPIPGDAATALTGQNTAGSANASTLGSRAAPPPQADPASMFQAPSPANPSTAVPLVQAQASGQAGPAGGAGGATGSSAPVDGVSNLASNTEPGTTGGFAQPAINASNALGVQSKSGAAQPTAADQVAVEIRKAAGAGKDHVRVRLNPAELGQIDISMKVRHDGTIRAIVTTDRPETFDLLQRDARGLERALQDAGLKTDSGSLSFNLRGGEQNGPNNGQRGTGGTAQANANDDRTVNTPPADLDVPLPVASGHALDIRV
jgi:hypothetical protein